ncbi:pre-mRNA-processing protein 40C isoform X4 [Carex littledalei]|uniref:Pre-mRNA-processing protein 40C isoform X4 n=1 Tax=Carex littledalei TaxID=544730 RepID=A0A833VIK3_9POAL|nr:pre-mRNA-processing protein 40C isoform X4 [Carex littledalei]
MNNVMSTTEPPIEEVQSKNAIEVPDAQIVDRSVSEVIPTSESPATENLTAVTSASMATPVSSSQVLEPVQSTPITICTPSSTSSSPKGVDGNPNVSPHDVARPGLSHQSFSFGALPRSNVPFGGNQQSPSQTVMRSTLPISPASIQPPVPSQYMGNRPPFGYNMVPHGTASSSPGQQFQPNNVANQTMNGQIFRSPNSVLGLQPPVPMQPPRPNTAFPGPVPPNVPAPRPPLPLPPRGDLSHQPNLPSSMDSQQASSEIVAGPQPMQFQPVPSFPRPETVGVAGNPVPGPPNFQMRPMIPSPSLMQTPTQLYQNQLPGHGPVLQPQWPHQPPQAGVFQRSPLQPNLGTMPMIRPPGVLPGNTSGLAPTVAQRSDETHTDQFKEANQVPAQEAENVLDVWTAHKTEAGLIYYYNSLTGKSTYEKPVGFKGEPEKVTGQSTPISWEKLPGTEWTLVTTNDGKKYYYDSKNKVSSWKIPPEVAEILKKQQMETTNDTPTEVQNQKPLVTSVPAVLTGGSEAVPLRQAPSLISPSALDTIKKKLQDAGTPGAVGISDLNGSKLPDGASSEKPKEGNGDGNVSDSSSDSDDGESGPTKEDCILQFKEMLKERGVLPFATWEKELPKIIFDPRFKVCLMPEDNEIYILQPFKFLFATFKPR